MRTHILINPRTTEPWERTAVLLCDAIDVAVVLEYLASFAFSSVRDFGGDYTAK